MEKSLIDFWLKAKPKANSVQRFIYILLMIFLVEKAFFAEAGPRNMLAPVSSHSFSLIPEILQKWNKSGIVEKDFVYYFFQKGFNFAFEKVGVLDKDDPEYFEQLLVLKNLIFQLDIELKKTSKIFNLQDAVYQELLVLASYIEQMEMMKKSDDESIDLYSAIRGCTSPDHLERILSYFVDQSKKTPKLGEKIVEVIKLAKENLWWNPVLKEEVLFQDEVSPTLDTGGTIVEIDPYKFLQNVKKGERLINYLKSYVDNAEKNYAITGVWIMPCQFVRAYLIGEKDNKRYQESGYARSAGCVDWNVLTPLEEVEFIRYCSNKGITVFWDTVMNHTGRDEVLGIQSGPYPDECYIRENGSTYTWDGGRDSENNWDTIKLDYNHEIIFNSQRGERKPYPFAKQNEKKINLTYEYAYQEMASRFRWLRWKPNGNVKTGIRYDVPGSLNNIYFWNYMRDRFKDEFGGVPPGIAEDRDEKMVIPNFGKDAAIYAETVMDDAIASSFKLTFDPSNDSFNGIDGDIEYNLGKCFSDLNQLWEYSLYITYTNHDKNEHYNNYFMRTFQKKLEKQGYVFDDLSYAFITQGFYKDELFMEKMKVFIALAFLGFPGNANSTFYAGDEFFLLSHHFLNREEPFSDLRDPEIIEKIARQVFKKVVKSEREMQQKINELQGLHDFFTRVSQLRKEIFRDKNFKVMNSSLLQSSDHLWVVKYTYQRESTLQESEITDCYIVINKTPPLNPNTPRENWVNEKKNVQITHADGTRESLCTVEPWGCKVIQKTRKMHTIKKGEITDKDGTIVREVIDTIHFSEKIICLTQTGTALTSDLFEKSA